MANNSSDHMYQWQHKGKWYIGIQARDVNGDTFSKWNTDDELLWLMKSDNELHWVKSEDLQPYPSEKHSNCEVTNGGE
jgi:hypothetical protein